MMNRRAFLGLGLAPLGLAPLALALPAHAAQANARPMSRAARNGFLPNVPLVAHTGKHVQFYDDLVRDKTVLLNFFLVRCTEGRCPTAIAKLRAVQDLLGERMGRDFFFYSITLDPKHDTPAMLREYAKPFDIKPGWLFLTGKPKDVGFLRRSLGFVDADPERDKDPANHSGMARCGSDRLERWTMVSLRSSPKNIATTLQWL